MNGETLSDSEERSDFNPSQSISTLADLQVKSYENRVRERLLAKYPTPTPAEARRLEKEIEKLVQIYAQGRILLQGRSVGQTPPRSRTARDAFHPKE
jgi:hypothetical protein